MTKMTTLAKLEQAKSLVTKYEAEVAAETIRNNIEAGDVVVFNFGRGDTKKSLSGTVVGIKDDTNGRWVAITAGEGFDMQRYTVRTADIVSNADADKRAPAAASKTAKADGPKDPLDSN